MELLGGRSTVLAPDYPTLLTFQQFDEGLSAVLTAEGIDRFHLIGQSYGGLLAQPFLARHPQAVDRLVLSSSGPADYGAPGYRWSVWPSRWRDDCQSSR